MHGYVGCSPGPAATAARIDVCQRTMIMRLGICVGEKCRGETEVAGRFRVPVMNKVEEDGWRLRVGRWNYGVIFDERPRRG